MNTSSHDYQLDILKALLQQEQTYLTCEYISKHHAIDQRCRLRMVQWNYAIADHCNLKRETVAIAMDYVDRFFSTRTGELMLQNRKEFQLVCVAAFYTAVKIHEQLAISPAMLASMSRGMHTEKDIQDMEYVLVEALRWKLNPPTSMVFVREYLGMCTTLSTDQRQAVLEIARLQCEFAVENYGFVSKKPSMVAFLALSNALKAISFQPTNDIEKVVKSIQTDAMISIASIDDQNKLAKATRGKHTKNAGWLIDTRPSIQCRSQFQNSTASPRCVDAPLRGSECNQKSYETKCR